jgi:phenylacetate-CoA ligase
MGGVSMIEPIEPLRRFWHTFIPLPVKYGSEFRRTFEFLQKSQHGSREEIESYQWQRIQALVTYAYEHVPYYRQTFDRAGIHPQDIKTRDDYRRLPVLYKEDVVENFELLKSDEFEKLAPISTVTSSSTRDGLRLYRSEHTEIFRKAVVWRHFFNIGFRFRDRRAQLTVPLSFARNMYEMPVDYNENMLMIDSRAITPEFAPQMYRRLQAFSPEMLFCQPSNAVMFVEYCRQSGLSPLPIPIVYVLGEKVYPEYHEILSNYFGGRIVQFYGNRENTASAGELEDGRMYINSDFCYLEFVSANGNPVLGQHADIISTALENYAFPLIRYHTEDVGVLHGYPNGVVRNFPVMEIIGGRGKDLLLTRNGLFLPQTNPFLKSINFDRYKRIQLEQKSLDDLIVRVVPTPAFNADNDRCLLESSFTKYFSGQFKITIEVVGEISRTSAGKNRYVISDLAIKHLRESLPCKEKNPTP